MLTLFEFTVLGAYMTLFLIAIVAIQVLNPGKLVREAIQFPSEKDIVESEEEEEEEGEEPPPFNPETEPYTMTENPMLRHRVSPSLEDVD